MTIELFDLYTNFGARLGSTPDEPENIAELLQSLEHYKIQKALIGHHFSIFGDVDVGNREALNAVQGNENLWAVGSLSPEFDNESPSPEEYLDNFINKKGRAIRLNPKYRGWSLEDWCSKELLDALENRQMPILLPWDETCASDINNMLKTHPKLNCILIELSFRNTRKIIPLMKNNNNLFACIGPRFSGHDVIENFCRETNANRLIFGTHYPISDPGATISMLMYARIHEEERSMIASKNLTNLIEGVK